MTVATVIVTMATVIVTVATVIVTVAIVIVTVAIVIVNVTNCHPELVEGCATIERSIREAITATGIP